GVASLLLGDEEARLNGVGRHRLEAIADAARRMGELIDDLLAFSRMSRTELRRATVDLDALTRSVIEDLAEELRGRRVRWIMGALPEVEGDPAMLRQVITNLLANAGEDTGTP